MRRPSGDQVFDLGAVEVGPLDPVAPLIRFQYILPAVDIQGQPSGGGQSGGDQVFDLGAVEVGPLDPVGTVVGPVHLAGGLVQSYGIGNDQPGCD